MRGLMAVDVRVGVQGSSRIVGVGLFELTNDMEAGY